MLPAAGIGARMGTQLPKQYLQVAGATLLEHSLRALLVIAVVAWIGGYVRPRTVELEVELRHGQPVAGGLLHAHGSGALSSLGID